MTKMTSTEYCCVVLFVYISCVVCCFIAFKLIGGHWYRKINPEILLPVSSGTKNWYQKTGIPVFWYRFSVPVSGTCVIDIKHKMKVSPQYRHCGIVLCLWYRINL